MAENPLRDLRDADAGVGLPARDQRREADAGRLQQDPRRPGRVLGATGRSDLRAVGGWPDAIGEDIVLTWSMLAAAGLVEYEPVALGFTAVPGSSTGCSPALPLGARDAGGPRAHPPAKQPRVLAKFVASIDYLVPFLDFGLVFFWVPGVILFLLGFPLIFSW